MAFALGAAIYDGLIIGGLIGGTVLVVGGTIALIIEAVDEHNREMRKIQNLRDQAIRNRVNHRERDLHKHKEFQEVFKLFQLEVEQARKLIEEAEYTDRNGEKIKGYNGRNFSSFHQYAISFQHWLRVLGGLKQRE